MTKYREIIRLASLNLSQTNIALSCGVSKKTVNKVLKAAREKESHGRLTQTRPMQRLSNCCSRRKTVLRLSQTGVCRIMRISARSFSVMG